MATPNNEKLSLETKNSIQENIKFGPEKQKFYDLILKDNTINPKTKENIRRILEKLNDDSDFFPFIDSNPKLASFIDNNTPIDNLDDFIENRFLKTFISKLELEESGKSSLNIETKQEEVKVNQKNNIDNIKLDAKSEIIKSVQEEQKNNSEEQKNNSEEQKNNSEAKEKTLKFLNYNKGKFEKIFGKDSEFFQIIERNKENAINLEKELFDFLSNPKKRNEFFNKLAQEDKELYNQTFETLSNFSPRIKESIKDFVPTPIPKPDPIISQFPDAKDGEITKRGDIVSFGDKTIDLRDKKAYISGENGYKLETSISLPDTLDLKAEYLARKLELRETINTDKKILELLGNKKKIKQDIADLEKQKKGGLGEDTGVNIAINLLQKELEQIQAKLAVAVPNYRENQDDLLTSFLENSIKENEEKLNKLEGKYRKDLSELYGKSAEKVRENDEATRETTRFLDLIGFSSLPQEITDKIINNIINTSKRNENQIAELGFVANLKPGKSDFLGLNSLVGEDIVKQKKAFVKMFNKIMTGETEKPIPTSDNDLLNQEKEISNKYKQEINGILFKEPFEGTWKQGIMEDNLFKTNKKETTNKETK